MKAMKASWKAGLRIMEVVVDLRRKGRALMWWMAARKNNIEFDALLKWR